MYASTVAVTGTQTAREHVLARGADGSSVSLPLQQSQCVPSLHHHFFHVATSVISLPVRHDCPVGEAVHSRTSQLRHSHARAITHLRAPPHTPRHTHSFVAGVIYRSFLGISLVSAREEAVLDVSRLEQWCMQCLDLAVPYTTTHPTIPLVPASAWHPPPTALAPGKAAVTEPQMWRDWGGGGRHSPARTSFRRAAMPHRTS